jgi:hypothetical protein
VADTLSAVMGVKASASFRAEAFAFCCSSQSNYALLVDAKDDAAAAFYRHYGFVPYASNPLILFLPLATSRALWNI